MNTGDFPAPSEGLLLTHFLVVSDQERSRDFYQSLLGGTVILERDPVIIRVAKSWPLSWPTWQERESSC